MKTQIYAAPAVKGLKSYIINENLYPLEVVSRCSDLQLQVCKNYSHTYIHNLNRNNLTLEALTMH